MNGNWLRVTPAELARAKEDLDWAFEFARAAVAADDGRHGGTDKGWHAFEFLLHRHGVELDVATGEELLIDPPDPDEDDDDRYLQLLEVDWGYGPSFHLTPEQVATIARELADRTEEDLIRGVDPAELERAGIYPAVWDRPGELRWAAHYLPYAREFFAAAAKDGDAVICWLD
jgi:hypothetical protein